uniref:WD repeat and FYVE domain containing 2 n=1 Tax=Sus scrofa TaxID=9823 RepID=A0A8D2BJ74_PIG
MAAEIQPKPLTRKPILLQRVEGSQEVVNMAVIVPKEEGVISVSEDRAHGQNGVCTRQCLTSEMDVKTGPARNVGEDEGKGGRCPNSVLPNDRSVGWCLRSGCSTK